MTDTDTSAVALAGADLEPHRRELTAYCYRMLGSWADAQDAVQETMLKAWRSEFAGRSSVRTFLYRIATNVCLDQRRATRRRPVDLGGPSAPVVESLGAPLPESAFVLPAPTAELLDPAEVVEARETVRLAFLAALQHLPPRQRAVLVLAEVLRWSAAEIAELLGTSVAAVTSATQRARATMAAAPVGSAPPTPLAADVAGLLARYVAAFERYDVDALVRLLRDDATLSMPPYSLWLRGPADIATWMRGPGAPCRGSVLRPVDVNGTPGFAQWRADGEGHRAWALQVVESDGRRIRSLTTFLDVEALFPAFGLPLAL